MDIQFNKDGQSPGTSRACVLVGDEKVQRLQYEAPSFHVITVAETDGLNLLFPKGVGTVYAS